MWYVFVIVLRLKLSCVGQLCGAGLWWVKGAAPGSNGMPVNHLSAEGGGREGGRGVGECLSCGVA